MKRLLIFAMAFGIGIVVACVFVSQRQSAGFARRLADAQVAWDAEKAGLEAELERARAARVAQAPLVSAPSAPLPAAAPSRLSPEQIIEKLRSLRAASMQGTRVHRQAVYWLEELALSGPAALPHIRQFLALAEDLDIDPAWPPVKGFRDRSPLDFVAPPSLRIGLFDVVRRIGGPEAETILLDALRATGRGIEVAYLARVLQESAPNKYRDDMVAVAKSLLAGASPPASGSALDFNHREHLYGVLALFGDSTYAAEAQAQLVRNDGQVDRGALRYLQRALGAQSVPLAAQAYQNPILTNSAGREPLARLALNFVGADSYANEFYQRAINDPVLSQSHRKNLIEDLNQDGFPDTKNLTDRDLPLIENRIALIEQLAPSAMDNANAAAFKEAYKDLVNMREHILRPPAPK